jgi:single-strand DNA-binding protein
MPSFNRVTLIGNLTRDPELKSLPSGTAVCEFGLAMNRSYKTAGGEDREETTFVDCTAFAKQAEVLGQYVTKGRALFVEGRLKYDQWDDKNGGGKRSKITVVIDNFQFLGDRQQGGEGQYDNPRPTSMRETVANRGKSQRPQRDEVIEDKEQRFKDADIPFAWEGRSGQPL